MEASPLSLSVPKRLKAAWQALTFKADGALSDLRHPTAWLTAWGLGSKTNSGVYITPATAMTLSSYYAAVRAISEDIGKLPLFTYERLEPRGKKRAVNHPVYTLLHDMPNNLMSSMTWRETMTHYALTWGNAYSIILRDLGRIVAFDRPTHPSRVQPRFDENMELVYEIKIDDLSIPRDVMDISRPLRINQRDMIHLRGLGDGLTGYSIAQMASESIGLSIAAEKTGSGLFGNGLNPGGVISHPQTLSQEAQTHLRESITRVYGGPDNVGKWMIFEEGMTATRMDIPPEDAQFLQTREFQVSEIARWFRIPPHKIAHLKEATFSNIEMQALEYVVDTLMPWLVRWEQELKRKVFRNDEMHFAEHLVMGLLRGDSTQRSNYFRSRFYLGSLSPNDIRELENENPIMDENGDFDPAGDMYFMQNNLATLQTIAGTREPVRTVTNNQGQQFALIPLGGLNGHAKDFDLEFLNAE